MDKNHEQLWVEAKGLKVAYQKLLTEMGASYMELESVSNQTRAIEERLKEQQRQARALNEAFNKTAEALAKANGITNGNMIFDFDKQEVTDGQVSGIGDGQS